MDGNHARALLGVPPHATQDQIRRAFRAAARTVHPDRGGEPASFRRLIEARTQLLRTASVGGRSTDPFAEVCAVQRPASFSVLDVGRRTPVVTGAACAQSFEDILQRLLAA